MRIASRERAFADIRDGVLEALLRRLRANPSWSFLTAVVDQLGLRGHESGANIEETMLRENLLEGGHKALANDHVRQWLRQRHIERRHRRGTAYATATRQLQELARDEKLPTQTDLDHLFGVGSWKRFKGDQSSFAAAKARAWGTAKEDTEADLAFFEASKEKAKTEIDIRLSPWAPKREFEEILELAGLGVRGRNHFHAYAEAHQCNEQLTQEYITERELSVVCGLWSAVYIVYSLWGSRLPQKAQESPSKVAAHVLKAAASWSRSPTPDDGGVKQPFRVLEVGAGDGRLAFHLQKRLALQRHPIEVIASDDGSWGIKPMVVKHIHSGPKVVQMDCKTAVEHFRPQLVLCQWMPTGEDWTPAIRAVDDVESYILIGETDAPDGCCGAAETWDPAAIGPGWERRQLSSLSSLQYSRHDWAEFCGHGRTVSFQRVEK